MLIADCEQWIRGATQPQLDGFTIRRKGDASVKIRIVIHLEQQPEQYKVQPELGECCFVLRHGFLGGYGYRQPSAERNQANGHFFDEIRSPLSLERWSRADRAYEVTRSLSSCTFWCVVCAFPEGHMRIELSYMCTSVLRRIYASIHHARWLYSVVEVSCFTSLVEATE